MIHTTVVGKARMTDMAYTCTNDLLNDFNKRYNTKKFFSDALFACFINYDWSGNIRQLKNAVERMCILSDKTVVDKKLFLQYLDQEEDIEEINDECFDVEEFKNRTVIKLYSKYKSSRMIAKKMGISQSTANLLINKYIKEEEE